MKPGLAVGQTYEFSVAVRPEMQAQFGDTVIHPLYSTAAMIQHMEWAARQHLLPYLEPGEEGAGYHVDVKHLAATPIGASVTIRATVAEIQPGKVICRVEAWNEHAKIGDGLFTQAIVPLDKLYGESRPENLPNEEETSPPPAVLTSLDKQSRFQLEIIKWETGILPCTRYDEWLVCRAKLDTDGQTTLEEGPFLLRHEIEEWIEAMGQLIEGQQAGFQSDFLEPILKIGLSQGEPGEWECAFRLNATANHAPTQLLHKMMVDKTALRNFQEQLAIQIYGFPSRL